MLDKVFINRTLNLRRIKYVGLDMDHTLVRYHTEAFEGLAHEIMKKKLVARGYPEEVLKIRFEFERSIRGLVVDKVRGNLLKVSRHGAIRASKHGTKTIDYATQQKIYTGTYIDLGSSDYSSIDTSFSTSVAILYSQLVDLKNTLPAHNMPDFKRMFEDVVYVMDESHRDGSLKSEVAKNLDKYINKDPSAVEGLERFIKHDKKLFIVTNSDFHYTKLLLDYAINPYLKEHKSWLDLFFLVITMAEKPRFFYDNLKFLKVNPQDGTMTNYDEPLKPGIYQGGSAGSFEAALGVSGDDILYIGDHIYGDILRLKKDSNWRTALVLEELGDEIQNMKLAQPLQKKIRSLMDQKEPLEFELVELTSKVIESKETPELKKRIEELQNDISAIDRQISPLIQEQASTFNPHWGEVMRAGNEESYFAHQVDRFADIYMATLGDLLSYSPRTYFRARRRPLAHELALSLVLEQE